MLKKTLFILLFLILSEVLSAQCLTGGTLLFKEDFGGNNVSDPRVKNTGLGTAFIAGYTYKTGWGSGGAYVIAKDQYTTPCGKDGVTRCISDHTHAHNNTRGYCMLVDGYHSSAAYFYKLPITSLCGGTNITVSFWYLNLHLDSNPINLAVRIVDPSNNQLAYQSTGVVPGNTMTDWKQMSLTIMPPSGAIIIYFEDKMNTLAGDDFAIDDIEVRLCAPPVTINVTNISLCAGEPLSLSGSFVNDGTFTAPLAYRWFFSATNDSNIDNWTIVGNTQNLNIANVTTANAGYYRLAVSSLGSINSKNCRAMSDAMQVTIKPASAKPIIGYD